MKWNNMKDGLPPVGASLIVTIYDSVHFRRELRYPVTYRKCFYSEEYGFFQYGHEDGVLLPEFSNVLAWAEIPKPFEEDEMSCTENPCMEETFSRVIERLEAMKDVPQDDSTAERISTEVWNRAINYAIRAVEEEEKK